MTAAGQIRVDDAGAMDPERVALALVAQADDEHLRPNRDERSVQIEAELRQAAETVRRYLSSPEPPEPPPGVYRDACDGAWKHSGVGTWFYTGSGTAHSWEDVQKYAAHPLVRLWGVDQLVPDPEDGEAVMAVNIAAGEMGDGHYAGRSTVAAICRVLRSRAEEVDHAQH